MERIIHNYQDKLDGFEDKIDVDIDEVIEKIDIKEVINNPSEILIAVAEIIMDRLDEYYPDLIKNGIKFAEKINAKSISKDGYKVPEVESK